MKQESVGRAQHPARDHRSLWLVLGYLAVVFLAGGASRADEPAQLFIRLAAIGFAAVALLRLGPGELARVRAPLLLLGSAILLLLLQLLPLPPGLWHLLPGRSSFAAGDRLVGVELWRPLSLTPDLTLNALFALWPPLALLLLVAPLRRRHARAVLASLVVLLVVSALYGLLQAGAGFGSLYGARTSGFESANGLLANRNHQAVALALVAPVTAWLVSDRRDFAAWQLPLGGALTAFAVLGALVTGSRAGVVMVVLGLTASVFIYRRRRGPSRTVAVRVRLAVGGAALVIGIMAVLAASRSPAVQRLFAEDPEQELRVRLFGRLAGLATEYLPFGGGFGSFVDLYKMHERLADLSPQYLNHAHNDWLELVIEGGLPAVLLVAAAIGWVAVHAARLWFEPADERRARLALVMLGLLGLASLADYPLRTPIGMTLAAVAFWLLTLTARPDAGTRQLASPAVRA